jgi:hypothetical protein
MHPACFHILMFFSQNILLKLFFRLPINRIKQLGNLFDKTAIPRTPIVFNYLILL